MFNGLKALLGGGNQASAFAMIKPMLPMIKKQAKPALTEAFKDKVRELHQEHLKDGIIHDNLLQQEVGAFVTIRNGELKLQWALIEHYPEDELTTIEDVFETLTLDDLLDQLTSTFKSAPSLPEVTQEPGFKYEVQTHGEPTEQPENLLVRAGATSQEQLFRLQRYLVVKIEGSYHVIEGPPPENETVYFGHNNEEIAQHWAKSANAQ